MKPNSFHHLPCLTMMMMCLYVCMWVCAELSFLMCACRFVMLTWALSRALKKWSGGGFFLALMTKVIPNSWTSLLPKQVEACFETRSPYHSYYWKAFRVMNLFHPSDMCLSLFYLYVTPTHSSPHILFHAFIPSHTPLNGLFLGYC